ncbi:MAG: class I SAM-dependent methyltransferase [Deltaproteobacteria bacterium]|nr:class I SAM-dependent methyltransferase [Deltaproteobacteria bacterium]
MTDYNDLADHYIMRRGDINRFDYNRDIEVPAMIKMLGNVANKNILELGCGFGDHAKRLSKQHFRKLVGLDLSSKFIQHARDQNIPHTEFYVKDISKKLPYKDGNYDIVFSSLALHYLTNLNKIFAEVNRVLKISGLFCFSTGHPIFNLINQSKDQIVGVNNINLGRRAIYGNYFDESPKLNNLGSLGKVRMSNFTLETFLRTALNSGFELADYMEAKPARATRKYDPWTFKLTSTLPTFILFKFQKKSINY